jgi:Arf-GAP/coiled-coil/ANK repeat/PH domain-containing protein
MRIKHKLYSRRWFSIRNGQLLYMKRNNSNSSNDSPQQQQLPHSVMVPDLRICTIRPMNDNDRRFVFEILSPNRLIILIFYLEIFILFSCFSSHLLQADSQIECEQWINSLHIAISNSFKSPSDSVLNSASVCISI